MHTFIHCLCRSFLNHLLFGSVKRKFEIWILKVSFLQEVLIFAQGMVSCWNKGILSALTVNWKIFEGFRLVSLWFLIAAISLSSLLRFKNFKRETASEVQNSTKATRGIRIEIMNGTMQFKASKRFLCLDRRICRSFYEAQLNPRFWRQNCILRNKDLL